MKKFFVFLSAAIAVFSSCNKDSIESVMENGDSVERPLIQEFRAYIEGSVTKSDFTGSNVIWTPNDGVMIFSGTNEGTGYTVKEGTDGTGTAVFVAGNQGTHPSTRFDIDDNVAFFPSQYAHDLQKSGDAYSIMVDMESGFANDCYGQIPMVAVTDGVEDTDLYFKNVYGLLEIPVISEGGMLYAVTVQGNDGEKISGTGTVTVSKDEVPEIVFEGNGANDIITVEFSHDGLALSSTPTSIYVPVPPTTFSKGITVTFYGMLGSDFGSTTKKTSAEVVINRSKVRSMDVIDFGTTPSVIYYKTTDKQVLEPATLHAWDKEGNELSYTNVYQFEQWLYGEELGMIKFDGAAEDIELSFFQSDGTSTLSGFLGSMGRTNLVSGRLMFANCMDLNYVYFSNMSTSKVTDMTSMFANCVSLADVNTVVKDQKGRKVSLISTDNVEKMGSMFFGCRSLDCLDLSMFNTSKVQDMSSMFSGCESLVDLDLDSFDTKNVTTMNAMFNNCASLEHLNISSFNTGNVTDMTMMFSLLDSISEIDLSSFNTSKVTSMMDMFAGDESLRSIEFGKNFNTSNNKYFQNFFANCSSLASVDLSTFNTEKALSMANMFSGCAALKELDLSTFDTKNVTSISGMFYGCSSLAALDLSSFDTSLVTKNSSFLRGTSSLKSITVGPKTGAMPIGYFTFDGMKDYSSSDEHGTLYYPAGTDYSTWLVQGKTDYKNLYDYGWVGEAYGSSDGNIGGYPGYDDKVNW